MTIYAIKGAGKTARDEATYKSLCDGEGRFGWSSLETADLEKLRERIDACGWQSLTEGEQESYHEFLLDLREGDHVVYVNVPEWGYCTLARVTGPYTWRRDDEDFNHRFSVDRTSVRSFDRNSEIVPRALSARLKLQGRWWRVYAEDEFEQLLTRLPEADRAITASSATNLRDLSDALGPLLRDVTARISRTHPGKELEPLIAQVFQRVPGVRNVERLQGRADRGADLLVEFERLPLPGLIDRQTVAVQVKSHDGVEDDLRAVKQIEQAFKFYKHHNPPIESGLIVSTASKAGEGLMRAVDFLSEQEDKRVSVLLGADLARFVLRYGADLFEGQGGGE